MNNETILVIDDNHEIQQVLKRFILEPAGYRVITALDGKTGLEMAIRHNPDLILLDMNLPRLTGLQLLDELRQTPCTSPVIFMTVHGSEQVAVEAFRLGVRDYLNKPFTAEEVQNAIDNALRERRLAEEREELSHNLVSAETVRVTIVTLSHYLNNHLMVLSAGLNLLDEELHHHEINPELLQIVHDSYQSVRGIQAVMQVLRNVTKVSLTPYTPTTPMIDIQGALRKALEQL